MKKNQTFDDDDGRTVADMSGIERPSMFLPRSIKKHGTFAEKQTQGEQKPRLTHEQRKSYLGGAVSAAALIALIFIAAGAILIALLTLIWH